tara:strand:- start:91 stop:246 length:156 start_codon:yes stop_codon:yes gene_type:complete
MPYYWGIKSTNIYRHAPTNQQNNQGKKKYFSFGDIKLFLLLWSSIPMIKNA